MFRLFRARLAGGIAVGVTIWHNGPAIPGGSVTNSISSSPELAATEWRIERLRSSRTIWVRDAARNAAGPSAASSGPYSLAKCNSQRGRREPSELQAWVDGAG